MPVFVGEMSTEVTALDGELPLTPAQIEALVRIVLSRLDQVNRERKLSKEATAVRTRSTANQYGGGDES